MDESTRIERLSAVSLFARLNRKSLKKLAALCVPRNFGVGECMVKEGDTGLGLFLVTSGKVRIVKGEAESAFTLAELGAGDVIGEMALLDDQPRSASVMVLEPTESLLISREGFAELAHKDPEIAWCIVPALAERLRATDSLRADAALGPAQNSREAELEAEAEEREASGTSTESESDDESEKKLWEDGEDAAVRILQLQYAVAMGAVEGLTGMLKVSERFFSTLADETELRERKKFKDLADKFPDGLIEATKAAISESEEVPDRMASSFRRYVNKA